MAIINRCFSAALKNTFDHKVGRALGYKYNHPKHPAALVLSCMMLQKEWSTLRDRRRTQVQRTTPGGNFLHSPGITQYKKVTSRYDIAVAFSAPDHLKKLCPEINTPQERHNECDLRLKQTHIPLQIHIIYELHFTCSKVNVGHSSRCVNTRLRGYDSSLKSTPAGYLAVYVTDCHCNPILTKKKVLQKFREKRSRELYEAMTIKEKENSCVSAPSGALSDKRTSLH